MSHENVEIARGESLERLYELFHSEPELIERFPDSGPDVKNKQNYLAGAQWALRRVRLAMLAADREGFENILDFACGWGRVLRALKPEFPEANLTACDIHRPAVDYCAELFGARPVYGDQNISAEDLGTFDLVWSFSLLTHVDEPQWDRFLQLFEEILEPGGVLIFSTAGPFVAESQMRGERKGLSEEQSQEMLRSYHETGFGYTDYSWLKDEDVRERLSLPSNYGLSLASPAWVCSKLEGFKFDLLTYTSGGWGDRWGGSRRALPSSKQDVIGCIRTRD